MTNYKIYFAIELLKSSMEKVLKDMEEMLKEIVDLLKPKVLTAIIIICTLIKIWIVHVLCVCDTMISICVMHLKEVQRCRKNHSVIYTISILILHSGE